jgi:hypothetical protein
LLETLNFEQTDTGQWVHVIGYLTFVNPALPVEAIGPQRHPENKATVRVGVQALLLWVARDLDLGTYEKSMLAETNDNTERLATQNLSIG